MDPWLNEVISDPVGVLFLGMSRCESLARECASEAAAGHRRQAACARGSGEFKPPTEAASLEMQAQSPFLRPICPTTSIICHVWSGGHRCGVWAQAWVQVQVQVQVCRCGRQCILRGYKSARWKKASDTRYDSQCG
jgi:hypothetical protein